MFTQEEKSLLLQVIGQARFTGTEAEIKRMFAMVESIREKLTEKEESEEIPASEE